VFRGSGIFGADSNLAIHHKIAELVDTQWMANRAHHESPPVLIALVILANAEVPYCSQFRVKNSNLRLYGGRMHVSTEDTYIRAVTASPCRR
jgi:hypothetical protein